jgi:hypothetical protein
LKGFTLKNKIKNNWKGLKTENPGEYVQKSNPMLPSEGTAHRWGTLASGPHWRLIKSLLLILKSKIKICINDNNENNPSGADRFDPSAVHY